MIYKRSDGRWVNKRNDKDNASSLHVTQKEAGNTARDMLQKQGGGELTINGVNGRIRDKNTISPGKDPCPPKDKR